MFKGWSREHKKIRHDHLCKTSQWPFIFDSSQLYLVSHKKVWLTVCRSPPVIPTDTCALSYLSTVEEHIKRRLKLKLKTRWSNVWLSLQMIISIRKYKTKTKTKKITIIEMYQTVVSCGGFFPPSVLQVPQMMQCAQPHNIKWPFYHHVQPRQDSYSVCCAVPLTQTKRSERKRRGCQQQHVCLVE